MRASPDGDPGTCSHSLAKVWAGARGDSGRARKSGKGNRDWFGKGLVFKVKWEEGDCLDVGNDWEGRVKGVSQASSLNVWLASGATSWDWEKRELQQVWGGNLSACYQLYWVWVLLGHPIRATRYTSPCIGQEKSPDWRQRFEDLCCWMMRSRRKGRTRKSPSGTLESSNSLRGGQKGLCRDGQRS